MSNTGTSLLYFPIKQFSPRFGNCFFTVEIISFTRKKATTRSCCVSDVIFYEVEVKRGRMAWRVFRRYSEFASLFESLDKEDISPASNPAVPFPRKSFYRTYLHDPVFLELRKNQLEAVLDRILTAASTRSVAITHCTAITSFLELNETHETYLPLM